MIYDVIIIGAGPAGLTAAIYACRRELKTLVISKDLGGQIAKAPDVRNFPGFEEISGAELTQKMMDQAQKLGAEVVFEGLKSVQKNGKNFEVHVSAGKYTSKALILAYGKTPRSLGVPGEDKFTGKGVSYCATCLPPSQDIVTEQGLKPIEQIKSGESVLTHCGVYGVVEESIVRPYKGELVELHSRFFRTDTIKLTPNHPVLVIKTKKCVGGSSICKPVKEHTYSNYGRYWKCKGYYKQYKPEWIKAGELTKEHYLLYPIFQTTRNKKYLKISDYVKVKVDNKLASPINKRCSSHSIPNTITINEDFMRLAGYYLAEGFSHARGVSFTFNKNEKEYTQDTLNLLKKVFGTPVSIRIENQVAKITVSSQILKELFKNLFGTGANLKHVPSWMLALHNRLQKELVKGMWRGDGCKVKKDFVYVTNSKELANQLKIILLRLGIISSISLIKKDDLNKKIHTIENREIKFRYDKYHISVGGPFLEKICEILGETHEKIQTRNRKLHYGWVDKNYAYVPIREIRRQPYVGHVYNLTIKNYNSYTTNNSTLHNCDMPVFRNKTVAILGGGNSALDAAIYGSKIAKKIYVIHRREGFRADEIELKNAKKAKNIEFVLNAIPKEIKGDKFVKSIIVEDVNTKQTRDIPVDGIFVEIGYEVKTDIVAHLVKLDNLKQIIIDNTCATSQPGIFAAGDITNTPMKQSIVAAGEGAKAALSAYTYIQGKPTTIITDWGKKN
jgi:thioredoxin reductase/intein/homing endonuclease